MTVAAGLEFHTNLSIIFFYIQQHLDLSNLEASHCRFCYTFEECEIILFLCFDFAVSICWF